jgi:predicted HicB family RNase H-like nuclease
MTDVLRYKEFLGSVHFSAEDEVFFGRIEGVDDLVSFEGSTVAELKSAFEEAVEDYLELCQHAGKSPEKSFKGSFNVRVSPDLHKMAYRKALMAGKTLNQFIQQAIEHEVSQA